MRIRDSKWVKCLPCTGPDLIPVIAWFKEHHHEESHNTKPGLIPKHYQVKSLIKPNQTKKREHRTILYASLYSI